MRWWQDIFGTQRIAELQQAVAEAREMLQFYRSSLEERAEENNTLSAKLSRFERGLEADLAERRLAQNTLGAENKFRLVKQTNLDLRETMKRAVLALDAVGAAHVLPNEVGAEIGRVADGLRDFTDLPGRSYNPMPADE